MPRSRVRRTQHHTRLPLPLYEIIQVRAMVLQRSVNQELSTLVAAVLSGEAKCQNEDVEHYCKINNIEGAPRLKPIPFRIPHAAGVMVRERARASSRSFNDEFVRTLLVGLAAEWAIDSKHLQEFTERLQRDSQPQPVLGDQTQFELQA